MITHPTIEGQVADVREASRQTVRELGILKSQPLAGGLSFTQCHVFLELDRNGRLSVGELAENLRLDKSTTSRAVAPLTEKGYLKVLADPEDQRRKLLLLTAKGRKQVQGIHQSAARRVDAALRYLEPEQRAIVVQGMNLYAQALKRTRHEFEVVIRSIRKTDNPEVEQIIRRVMTEFGAVGCGYSIEDDEVRAMYEAYNNPVSAYFVAEYQGKLVGGAGIAPLEKGDPNVCELRKMYMYPEGRGLGIGRRLLEASIQAAKEAGYKRCYLETLEHMTQAQRLYEKFGFQRLDHAEGQTGHYACDRWYALDL